MVVGMVAYQSVQVSITVLFDANYYYVKLYA